MGKKKYSFIIILVILMATSGTLINSSVSDNILDSKFIKIAATSPVLWNTTWGGSENENAEGIVLDSSGNVYVTGKTASFGVAGFGDVYLAKFNSTGGFERYFLWGGDAYEGGEAIALDSSGNAYVTGFTYGFESEGSDIILVKFHPIYGVEWYYTWGGSEDDVGIAITLDSLGNIYVAGLTNSFGEGNDDVCLVKFNPIGHVEWYSIWGGSGFDRGFAITLDSLGNAYITGETNSSGAGGSDIFLVKFNSTGGIEGNCTWGGLENEAGVSISLDSSGKAYVAGRTESFGAGSKDMCLVKFNSIDGVEWNSTWGGPENDEGFALTLDSSKNVYVTGGTGSFGAGKDDLCLVKFNSIGGVEWNYMWGGNESDRGCGITLDSSGNAYISGVTGSFGAGNDDVCLIKLDLSSLEEGDEIGGGGNDLILIIVITIVSLVGISVIIITSIGIFRRKKLRK